MSFFWLKRGNPKQRSLSVSELGGESLHISSRLGDGGGGGSRVEDYSAIILENPRDFLSLGGSTTLAAITGRAHQASVEVFGQRALKTKPPAPLQYSSSLQCVVCSTTHCTIHRLMIRRTDERSVETNIRGSVDNSSGFCRHVASV